MKLWKSIFRSILGVCRVNKKLRKKDNLIIKYRGDIMKNGIDFVISQKFWDISNNFGLNTNILETNLINLGVVLGLLIYFGKGVCAD